MIVILATFVGIWLLGKASRRADADDRLDRYGDGIMANRDILIFTRRIAGASICSPVINGYISYLSAGRNFTSDTADAF